MPELVKEDHKAQNEQKGDDVSSDAAAKRMFKFSLLYLFLHFSAFLLEAALKGFGLGGW